ncbi:DNA-processing protein DprA [Cryptosporangium minutisporangium]|uniref:Smf/DprA SLOG domain-containing protein n=1 Tax=Cryptosporangium minutisporangium TaxID=113569 RepID=A0ABP6SV19_9ACTN
MHTFSTAHTGASADERAARAVLSWLYEPGDRRLGALVDELGPQAAVDAGAEQTSIDYRAELRSLPTGTDLRREATRQVEQAQQDGMRILIPADHDWPPSLRAPDAPVCLWALGTTPLPPPTRTVAIIGSTDSTAYGTYMASGIAYGLAESPPYTVISTGAAGIDRAALTGALANHGHPVALCPGGLDLRFSGPPWPQRDQVIAEGLLLSAWPPGARPGPARARTNQRLLSRLVAGTVLVEADPNSRAIAALQDTLEVGGVGMAVPGPVTSVQSAGCHALLRDDRRVRLVTNAADVTDVLLRRAGRRAWAEPAGDPR